MTPIVHVTDDVGAVAARLIVEAIGAAVDRTGRCRLGIPGGTSPVPVFRQLAKTLSADLAAAVVVTWVDERHFGALEGRFTDWPAESNRRLAHEHWFSRTEAPPAELPMTIEGTVHDAAATYGLRFSDALGGLDVVLLGTGDDGHIASLFPGHRALDATGVCVAVDDAPKPPAARLTLTLDVLVDVDVAVLVATGSNKASVLARAARGDHRLPVGRYGETPRTPRSGPARRLHWVLDEAASAGLREPGTEDS